MSKKLDLRSMKAEAEAPIQDVTDVKEERFELTPREVQFTVHYDSPDGDVITDTLTSRVLDGDGRLAKTRVFNRLTSGLNLAVLPQDEELRLDAIARLVAQIVDLPEWLSQAMSMDNELLAYINTTLVEHERRYFRGNSKKSEDGQGAPRVSIDSPFSEE